MVTRTITATRVTVLCLDLQTCEPFNTTITLPRTYTSETKLMKLVEEEVNSETAKAVHIVDKEEIETLYGMTEADFIKSATVLDKETRKPVDAPETVDAE